MFHGIRSANNPVRDYDTDHGQKWCARFLLVTFRVQFVVAFNINIGSVVVHALESIAAGTNFADVARVEENLRLLRQHGRFPNVIDLESNIGVVHVIDLDHIGIVVAHSHIAAILLDQFWSVVTIR